MYIYTSRYTYTNICIYVYLYMYIYMCVHICVCFVYPFALAIALLYLSLYHVFARCASVFFCPCLLLLRTRTLPSFHLYLFSLSPLRALSRPLPSSVAGHTLARLLTLVLAPTLSLLRSLLLAGARSFSCSLAVNEPVSPFNVYTKKKSQHSTYCRQESCAA